MVAAEAQERDFYRAGRRAFLGDGAPYNWGIQRAYFPDFEPVNDFLHVLCYRVFPGCDEVTGFSGSSGQKAGGSWTLRNCAD